MLEQPVDPGVLAARIEAIYAGIRGELVEFRRDMHAHPELGYCEVRATERLVARLQAAGLRPRRLTRTGLVCDVPTSPPRATSPTPAAEHAPAAPSPGPFLGLRADLDALPITETTGLPYASRVPGVAHACGHDMHTTIVLGAGLVLHRLAKQGLLPGPVRLIFQPAEEIMPGGSHVVIDDGGLDEVSRILCVHADPRIAVGQVGLRAGPVTSAGDRVEINLLGAGGHTARPHLTQDLVAALGALVTGLPPALSRRLDPRAGVNAVFGRIAAGETANVVPTLGVVEGTIRCLDLGAWEAMPALLEELVPQIVAPYRVQSDITFHRGTPPVVNDAEIIESLHEATVSVLGAEAVTDTDQSLGAEDFAWYLERVPGALARLGVRPADRDAMADLHQGDFDPDEGAIGVGVAVLAATACSLAGR
jgi:amidohydrolase